MTEDEGLPDNHDELKGQLEEALRRIRELEAKQREDESNRALHSRTGVDPSIDVPPINEADVTLRRLVQRIAMILQAEKIVIMFFDRERSELSGIPPAYGVDEEHLKIFRVRAAQGISGQVFRDSEPVIFHDATNDPRTQKDPFGLLHVQNGITVPLVIEKRDEENRVVERTVIGVLHAFNKRHGEDFNDEDVRLLERMARNVGSIIANLQMYREVVRDREQLLQTFESLTAGLILVSPEGRLSQMNASARAIFGVGSEAIGKMYKDILRNEMLQEIFTSGTRGEDTTKREVHLNIHGSERIYEVQAAQVLSDEGSHLGVVAILNDMTEIKNIDKMKSSFVAMASHELRTPLTAIKGFVSTLLMDDDFTADQRREFHMIMDQECDRLTRLINDLLNTARIEANESLKPNYTRFSLQQLIEKCVMIQKQTAKRHQIELVQEEPMPSIIGDEDKLDQVLTNLLNNAIKYSPNGGQITVHVKIDGEMIEVGVRDQGLGIRKDHLGKVFEKFHRVDNEDNRKIYGTGLGLFLVKHLVEQVHLGKIWVESEYGVGSDFKFRIPRELDIELAKKLND